MTALRSIRRPMQPDEIVARFQQAQRDADDAAAETAAFERYRSNAAFSAISLRKSLGREPSAEEVREHALAISAIQTGSGIRG